MPVARITREGLACIALLVAILWGCVFLERSMVARARVDTYRAVREMRRLKLKNAVPTTAPRRGVQSMPPVAG